MVIVFAKIRPLNAIQLSLKVEQRMTKPADDLAAIRTVLDALEPFETADRQRILRFVLEKLNLEMPALSPPLKTEIRELRRIELPLSPPSGIKNLSSYVQDKNPKNDVQFAATVAYFYRFEVAPDKQKLEINADDLQDAARLAHRKRFKHAGQTLRNARNLGLLDSGSQEGFFKINSVGENLVAMTLPGTPQREQSRKPRKPRKPRKNK